jgi:ribosomal protein S18 acetylase RimI-like enzyme
VPRIRPRATADLDACVALLADVHETSGYPALWPADPRRWLMPSRLLSAWVAEDDSQILGHVGVCSPDGDAAAELWSRRTGRPVTDAVVITRLCVASGARGRKLGEQLLAAARQAATARHPVLEVLGHNTSAIALYDRLGWQRLAISHYTLPDGRTVPVHRYTAPG